VNQGQHLIRLVLSACECFEVLQILALGKLLD
jgi:hypothetical protein